MKNIFLISLIVLLVGCAQNDRFAPNTAGNLQIRLSMGGIDTRSIDESVYDETTQSGYKLPYSEIKSLKVELYALLGEGPIGTYQLTEEQLAAIRNTPTQRAAVFTIEQISSATRFVKVKINEETEADPDINRMQRTDVDNPTNSFKASDIAYEGTSPEINIPLGDSDKVTIITTIQVAPLLSRIEVVPGNLVIVDPEKEGYLIPWGNDRTKVKGFTAEEIAAAEKSAYDNHIKGLVNPTLKPEVSYAYCVELVDKVQLSQNTWQLVNTQIYLNYFKQHRSSIALVKNGNNDLNNWLSKVPDGGIAEYNLGGAHSNMWDPMPASASQVNAFNLFPQSASASDLVTVKDQMPHVILYLADNTGNSRWLTIRAFSNKIDGRRIAAFKPGTVYSLKMSDIVLTPWRLKLTVRVQNGGAYSDPIIKDFDQTSHVPEPYDKTISMGLTVRSWSDKNIEIEL